MKMIRGIYIPDDDTHFAQALTKGPFIDGRGTYQLSKLFPAINLLKHKGIALDIGAHVGLWSTVLAGHFDQVYAFEPYQPHIDCFRMNLEGHPNVQLHQFALGDTQDRSIAWAMTEVKGNSGNTHLWAPGDGDEVPMTPGTPVCVIESLDAVAETLGITHADFVKIDVEGYELQVVLGAKEFIQRNKPVMVVEQKPGNAERYGGKTGEVIDLLKEWGAEVVWVKAGDYCLRWRDRYGKKAVAQTQATPAASEGEAQADGVDRVRQP